MAVALDVEGCNIILSCVGQESNHSLSRTLPSHPYACGHSSTCIPVIVMGVPSTTVHRHAIDAEGVSMLF